MYAQWLRLMNSSLKTVRLSVLSTQRAKQYEVMAPAVVLAAGGFSANQDMVVKLNPKLKGFATTNHTGATGDGITLGEKAGAATVDMKQIQTHPTVVPGKGEMITEAVRGNGAILVNKDGKRFINELQTRDVVSAAELAQKIKLASSYSITMLERALRLSKLTSRAVWLLKEKIFHELAQKIGVDGKQLQATVDKYTKDQKAGKDSEFGRADMPRPLTQAPYYAVMVTPAVHHTMGGFEN